jgi:hypothetical protein
MGCDHKIQNTFEGGAHAAMPEMEDPVLSLTVTSKELDLDFEIMLPVKITQSHSFHGLLASFAAAVPSEVAASETHAANVKRFEDVLQKALSSRDERHAFYAQVQKNYDRMADSFAQMKRDYYREIDHLRAQISLSKRDPGFQHDNVFFFDPAAYQIPTWDKVVDQLDDRRMQRELLVEQGGNSIRTVPLHMLCQNCRSRFEGDPVHSMDEATQTELPSGNASTDEAIHVDTREPCSIRDADEAIPVNVGEDGKNLPHDAQCEDWDEDGRRMLPGSGNVDGLMEFSDQSTQTETILQSPSHVSTCDTAGSSFSPSSAPGSRMQDDGIGKKVTDKSQPSSGAITDQRQSKTADAKPDSTGEDRTSTITPAEDAQRKQHSAHGMKSSDTSRKPTRATNAAMGIAQQCFNAWKSQIPSHVVARRTKKAPRHLVKRQLAAIEAHIRRMAFVGWRHAAFGQTSEQTKAFVEEQRPMPAEESLRNKALGARPVSEPSSSLSRAANSKSDPMLGFGTESGCRPSSEPTLASRGEHRLRHLPHSGLSDTSEVRGYPDAESSRYPEPARLRSDGRALLRQQYLGADDIGDWQNERRSADVEENQQRALDKMTKTYTRRGASVPHAIRNGAGTSLHHRVPVQLTLQHLDVDLSVSNVRCSPLGTPLEGIYHDHDLPNLLSKQRVKPVAEKKGLSHVASLPTFGSAAQRSPTRSPPPLLSKHGRASHALKNHLRRAPYASN